MSTVLMLLVIQGLLGAFDNLWNHELKVRLPAQPSARRELALHAARAALYAPLFLAVGWLELRGWLAAALAALLLAETGITLLDFVEEDRSRTLPPNERVLHTLLAINYGAFLACALPVLLAWWRLPSDAMVVQHGAWSWIMSACALGALAWGVRDALAAWRLAHPALATWQRRRIEVRARANPHTILITGATGFIGRHLCWRLIERGHRVVALARSRTKAVDLFGPYAEVIGSLDHIHRTRRVHAVINLAGEPIAGARWTPARKAALVESRIALTRTLSDWMVRQSHRPAVLVSASAVGWYGARGEEPLTERSTPGEDFPAILCRAWEDEALRAPWPAPRVVVLRLGLVLGAGGLLARLLPLFRAGLGAPMGNGRQWMPWIHLEDVLDLAERAVDEPDMSGVYNAVAPEPATHAQFCSTLAAVVRRPLWPGLPAGLLRLALGEMATLLLDGQRVAPARLLERRHAFRYPALRAALEDLAGASAARGHAAMRAGHA